MGYQHVQDSSDLSDSSPTVERKKHKCTFKGCNAEFSKASKLVFHKRRHTGERPYACDESNCSKTYTNSSHLRRHKKVYHEKQVQSVICGHEGCGIVLSNKCNLKRHIKNKHTQTYAFSCSVCLQGFNKRRQLQQHLYLHTGEAPFKCERCNFSFVTMKDFSKHKKTHKTYTCECGNIFERWSLLLGHRKICRKNYKCEKCNKEFKQLGNYKSHCLTHEDKIKKIVHTCPYDDCKRFYFYKRNLIFHINRFHKKIDENLNLKCTYAHCRVILKTKQSLRQHLQRHTIKKVREARRTRKDKGIPKKCMASLLTNVEVPLEKHREIIEQDSRIKKSVENTKEVIEEPEESAEESEASDLLEQCDLALEMLKQKISKMSD